ncbi:MAG: 30S ribosomal protein S9 [Candidatus Vogelbacteria bacterium CG10_big_fil_rev_8_21_14_0_10_51_16]|uniref:Small ribosomal subunit protein uS9 n=1 Tax=Candidatus Vogelbacteria bacterium CG10_big_fil_rev_8_21_14_0_10_51_16 TaxID=1975045 RepID=A0A2H0REG6_9BACT|nr:MAG: 30S ribosomal protein S9 [Candidatus Vogelbacteria bacterium CG10_big_fil_rev_8_21_14_0_10_51_16]
MPTPTKTNKVKKTQVEKRTGKYFEAVGRRKTATARVRLYDAKSTAYTVNDRTLDSYFPAEELRRSINAPFEKLTEDHKYEVTVRVRGGGMRAQAEAIRHGIARALTISDGDLRKSLKSAKLLTRDARAKERRKFGLKKARKAPQWSKR